MPSQQRTGTSWSLQELEAEELNRRLATELPVPIIASGGAGTMEDFKRVFDVGVDAALAASVFHFGQIPIPELKKYLSEEGVAMRGVE